MSHLPTDGERLAVIEAVVLRTEKKLDDHIADHRADIKAMYDDVELLEIRVGRLEKLGAGVSAVFGMVAFWLKGR